MQGSAGFRVQGCVPERAGAHQPARFSSRVQGRGGWEGVAGSPKKATSNIPGGAGRRRSTHMIMIMVAGTHGHRLGSLPAAALWQCAHAGTALPRSLSMGSAWVDMRHGALACTQASAHTHTHAPAAGEAHLPAGHVRAAPAEARVAHRAPRAVQPDLQPACRRAGAAHQAQRGLRLVGLVGADEADVPVVVAPACRHACTRGRPANAPLALVEAQLGTQAQHRAAAVRGATGGTAGPSGSRPSHTCCRRGSL